MSKIDRARFHHITGNGIDPDNKRLQRAAERAGVSREELAALDPPETGIIEVYTDGACQGNPGPCSYGLLLRAVDCDQACSAIRLEARLCGFCILSCLSSLFC